MSVTLDEPAVWIRLRWWWERPTPGREVALRDPNRARAFLGWASARPGATSKLRRFMAEHLSTPVRRLLDAELLDQLAWSVCTGKVRVTEEARVPLSAKDHEAEQDAPVSVSWDAPPPESVVVVTEPPTFPEGIDAVAIARAKKEAARLGLPFCEECMKAQLAEQQAEADTFPEDIDAAAIAKAKKEAARMGAPFCEECMKTKRERDRAARGAPS